MFCPYSKTRINSCASTSIVGGPRGVGVGAEMYVWLPVRRTVGTVFLPVCFSACQFSQIHQTDMLQIRKQTEQANIKLLMKTQSL